jgi:hypothetical protein
MGHWAPSRSRKIKEASKNTGEKIFLKIFSKSRHCCIDNNGGDDILRESDVNNPRTKDTKMTQKTWTVTAVMNGEMVEYNGLVITEAKNAMAELEKDGAEWIESYREW